MAVHRFLIIHKKNLLWALKIPPPPPPNQVFWGTRFDIQPNNIVLLAIKSD
jgi:hypothetical protein